MVPKTALITDLDNTLFDWVELWLNCLSTMLEGIIEISGISREQLIPEIAAVHQRHGTSEYSFLIDELPSLQPILNGRPATEVFAAPIYNFRLQRRKHLKLYPSVAETLLKIKGRGTKIIGYTESMAFYSNYRVRHLGLDGVLDYVFCPGQAHKRPEYRLLQEVTRWTPEEVLREQRIREREDVHPTNVLENGFSEMLDLFDFEAFHARASRA